MITAWLDKLKSALEPTKKGLLKFLQDRKDNYEELWSDIEEALISTDIGVETAFKIVDELRNDVSGGNNEDIKRILKDKIKDILSNGATTSRLNFSSNEDIPTVYVFVGVNGGGKTTTIGKLAYKFKTTGKNVLIAASDTYRAAAIPQIEEWAKRCNVDILKQQEGADPAAVVYDALDTAVARNIDIVLVDTAGRLHTNQNLLQEIKKICRVCNKRIPEAPHEILLVIDAISGQNGLLQAQKFMETVNISGIVLTKLDGTAKGGIVISIMDKLNIPVKLVGVGEDIDDIGEFNSEEFVEALF
jgi:fused signal recognition particle receptor